MQLLGCSDVAPEGGDVASPPAGPLAGSAAGAPAWFARVEAACRGVGVRTVFQPIVDVVGGRVAGYEALTRFGRAGASPVPWFAAARSLGCVAELEAVALRTALQARSALPAGCFLSVNLSPDLLRHPVIRSVWREQQELSGVVVELTEQVRIDSYRDLEPDLDALRGAGALLAVDDAGAGYAGLRHVAALRPAIVKLDASLVSGVHLDAANFALIEMLGRFASRMDAWLLAEGVERAEELQTLARLGVPMVQGHFLGSPGPKWRGLRPQARTALRHTGDAGRLVGVAQMKPLLLSLGAPERVS
jgi:EAL domain-containing protein (putative c-di-GMP-specific phosphodiesterase class I)